MKRFKGFDKPLFIIGTSLVLITSTSMSSGPDISKPLEYRLSKEQLPAKKVISEVISDEISKNKFPTEVQVSVKSDEKPISSTYQVDYTIQEDLQNHAENLLKTYKPDYAAIVMMDAKTGEILAMTSFQKNGSKKDNLAVKATFPAASIFKVITASTAVDKVGISPDHKIAFNGGNYTLYKKNVLSDRITRWTRFISLKDAFARSINTAFGRLSLENLEPQDLSNYANKFYFNQDIPSDFDVDQSNARVPTEKGFALTEVASGYNRFNTLSPVHGAMIASTIVNDGLMPAPYVVKSIKNDKSEVIYSGESQSQGQIIAADSANKVREMMEQTVLSGTSRKSFRKMVRDRKFQQVEMGGKTGHMTGTNPKGRTDWFVGYASDENSRIAIAAVTVSVKYWTVKSATLGEMMFRKYFKDKIEERESMADDSQDDFKRKPASKKSKNRIKT